MLSFFANSRVVDGALGLVALATFAYALASGLPRAQTSASIRIAAALLPPQMDLDGEGREAEIIKAAFKAGGIGKPVEFHIMPFTRHWQVFNTERRFDAVATVPPDIAIEGIKSDVYALYQNGIFFRSAQFPNGLAGDPLRDISNQRIVAFAGSTSVLPNLLPLSRTAPLYIERADQLSHSVMMRNHFVDVVIADELIFNAYTRQLAGDAFDRVAGELAFRPAFCPTPYRLVFRDYQLRQAFNAGLAKISIDGTLQRIDQKYAALRKIKRSGSLPGDCAK